jgi:hypothetical protein
MTTLPSSVTDRSRALPGNSVSTATNVPDTTAILHLAGKILAGAHALLLPAAALFAGLLALGLQVNTVLYGDSVFLARAALVLLGIWLILWAVGKVAHGLMDVASNIFGGGGSMSPGEIAVKAGTDSAARMETPQEAPKEVARPKLALPADVPAHRYGATLDS